jgi:hypothetical protein
VDQIEVSIVFTERLVSTLYVAKLNNHFEKFEEVVCRLSNNMPLLDALQVPTSFCYFKNILANKYEMATLRVDHVKMSEQCSAAIANGL